LSRHRNTSFRCLVRLVGGDQKAFARTGDASTLADLLRNTGESLSITDRKPIDRVANALESVTLALDLARPQEARTHATSLSEEIDKATPHMAQYAKPFTLLKELVERTIAALNPPTDSPSFHQLKSQQSLVSWYGEKRRYALAILLAREWMISRYMNSGLLTPSQRQSDPIYEERQRAARRLSRDRTLSTLWDDLRELRNDIAHMGQNDRPKDARTLQREIGDVLEQIGRLE